MYTVTGSYTGITFIWFTRFYMRVLCMTLRSYVHVSTKQVYNNTLCISMKVAKIIACAGVSQSARVAQVKDFDLFGVTCPTCTILGYSIAYTGGWVEAVFL